MNFLITLAFAMKSLLRPKRVSQILELSPRRPRRLCLHQGYSVPDVGCTRAHDSRLALTTLIDSRQDRCTLYKCDPVMEKASMFDQSPSFRPLNGATGTVFVRYTPSARISGSCHDCKCSESLSTPNETLLMDVPVRSVHYY